MCGFLTVFISILHAGYHPAYVHLEFKMYYLLQFVQQCLRNNLESSITKNEKLVRCLPKQSSIAHIFISGKLRVAHLLLSAKSPSLILASFQLSEIIKFDYSRLWARFFEKGFTFWGSKRCITAVQCHNKRSAFEARVLFELQFCSKHRMLSGIFLSSEANQFLYLHNSSKK